MHNASLSLDGFPSFLNKGKESDESCSESVHVEYDSRSSSHEDFDEYLQLKNGNMMKATERQRQMLRDRSNARITNIRVPDTYFEQIGSILKRSLYLRDEEQNDEFTSDAARNRSPIDFENDAADEFFLGRETPPSPSPRQSSRPHSIYEMKTNDDSFIYATGDLPEQKDVPHTKHAAKRDVLSEDTLNEIRNFVDLYNEQEHSSRLTPCNDAELYESDNLISKPSTVSKSKRENHKRIPKHSSDRHGHSIAEGREQLKSIRSTTANLNRKINKSAPLVQKEQKARLRSDSGFRQTESENSLQWEIQKKAKKHTIRSSKDADDLVRNQKHGSDSRKLRSSDSERTIVADRREVKVRQLRTADRTHVPLAPLSASRLSPPPPPPHRRRHTPQLPSSEDLPQTREGFGSAGAYLSDEQSASDGTEKMDRRRSTATDRAPSNFVETTIQRNESRPAEENVDGGAFERRKTKKAKRLAAGGPTNSLRRAEVRAKARGSSEGAAAWSGKGAPKSKAGGEKDSADGVPMLLWSVDSRAQAKRQRAARKGGGGRGGGGGRAGGGGGGGGGGGEPLAQLIDPRAAGDASRHSDRSSDSVDEALEPNSSGPAPAPARRGPRGPTRRTPLTASKKPFR